MTDTLREEFDGEFNGGSQFLEDAQTQPQDRVLGNSDLPIAAYREHIEASMQQNAVTIVMASTGAGKTSQVPQYARELGIFDQIIVTQPRKIATVSLAERIEQEIDIAGESENHKVGFFTSTHSSPEPQHTKDIALLTDGKADAQLIHDIGRNSHKKRLLVIDEVHEWNLSIELLIALAAKKTDPTSDMYDPLLSVVIMSATMDGSRLQQFFAHTTTELFDVPVPTHKVERTMSDLPIAEVALKEAMRDNNKVLAFHAGRGEINATVKTIEERQRRLPPTERVVVVPLHGQLSHEEQAKAFEKYENGAVIASTNVAETSVTVPDAKVVVDSGEARVNRVRYDHVSTGSVGLYLEDIPRDSINQRAGRVGRTSPGTYILATQKGGRPLAFEDRPEYGTPAILRSQLDGFVLRIKAAGYELSDFRFFHKPPQQAIEAATKRLFYIGALDSEGMVTERGRFMERLPLDPELACMIAFAYEKGYSDEVKRRVIDIAAIMQRGGILKRAPKEQKWRHDLLPTDSDGECLETVSDYFAQHQAYIELMTSVKREDWKRFDIIENSADLVEQDRATLAERLQLESFPIAPIAKDDRQALLTCIYAGQLSQIWQRKGDYWTLLLEESGEFDLAESSVVRHVGQLATGSLFTLGLRSDSYTAVQNVHRVTVLDSLEQAAAHLVTSVPLDRPVYDPLREGLVVREEKRLGSFVLRTVVTPFAGEADDILQEGHNEHAWQTFLSQKVKRAGYSIETIDAVIEDPEAIEYGVDIVTGEPLLAYIGGKGLPCRTREIAIESLQASKAKLLKGPARAQRREERAAEKIQSAELRAQEQKQQPAKDPQKAKTAKRLQAKKR